MIISQIKGKEIWTFFPKFSISQNIHWGTKKTFTNWYYIKSKAKTFKYCKFSFSLNQCYESIQREKIKNSTCSDNHQQWLKRGWRGFVALNLISEYLDQNLAEISTSLYHEVDFNFDCGSSLDPFVLEEVSLLLKSWNPLFW